ncbi:MAG: hypothetical protein QF704_05810, partial [Anaerolineales bacterium]|nr:hypothetical protein [Anaerolineales bacterium]
TMKILGLDIVKVRLLSMLKTSLTYGIFQQNTQCLLLELMFMLTAYVPLDALSVPAPPNAKCVSMGGFLTGPNARDA